MTSAPVGTLTYDSVAGGFLLSVTNACMNVAHFRIWGGISWRIIALQIEKILRGEATC